MQIPFVKMHGIGNDFVVIDNLDQTLSVDGELARGMADRHFGIGADQVLVIEPSETCDCRMLIYNADGSRVEMCGNGIRCVAAYMRRRRNVSSPELRIETIAGERKVSFRGDWIRVDMGAPVFSPPDIPVEMEGDRVVMRDITAGDKTFSITAVSMGAILTACFSWTIVVPFPWKFTAPSWRTTRRFPGGQTSSAWKSSTPGP